MPQLRHRQNDRIQNRYEVRRLLGSGAFGTVYGCRDLEIDVPVAVKELHVLDENGGERESALKQFRAEATHLSKLRHPHIVSGHYEPFSGDWHVCPICGLDFPGVSRCPDHGAALIPIHSRHYLVMEYIAGPDLLQLAEQNGGKINVKTALIYARHIASALSFIHARGFVHRDIKPENIRLRADADEAVLLDFGIATKGEEVGDSYGTQAQRHTTGGGTIGYAPEAPAERRAPDARSDIHAFGMTLYHLLTARDPTEPNDLRQMRTHTPRDFEPKVPDALDQLIVECTDMTAANRPQNGAELVSRLEQLGGLAPVAKGGTMAIAPPTTVLAPEVTPLVFRSGHGARDVGELVPLLDHFPAEAAQKLMAGEVEQWLGSIGEREMATQAREVRARYQGRNRQALEAFAQATRQLEPPLIEFSTHQLNFGALSQEGQRTIQLQVENRGRGHLFGSIRASHPAVSTFGEWDGNRAKIPVTFDANRLRPGKYTGELILDSSAGERVLPFVAKVNGPSWLAPFLVVLLYGIGGSVAGGAMRRLPFIFADDPSGLQWLNHAPKWTAVSPWFGAVFGAIILSWIMAESFSRISCSLRLSIGLFGTLLISSALILGNYVLAEGDSRLQPLGTSMGVKPEIAWIFAMGLIGAFIGSWRRFRDILSVRFVAIALGWIATLMLTNVVANLLARTFPYS